MPYCPSCGAAVEVTAPACRDCGHQLRQDRDPDTSTEDGPRRTSFGGYHDAGPHERLGAFRFATRYPFGADRNPVLTLGALTLVAWLVALFVALVGLVGWVLYDTIGGFLVAALLAVVPLVLVAGYASALLATAVRGALAPPPVQSYDELVAEGLFVFLAVAPLALGGSLFVQFGRSIGSGPGLGAALFVGYCAPAVLLQYAATGDVRCMYGPRSIAAVVLTRRYSAYALGYVVLLAGLALASGVLLALVLTAAAVPALLAVVSAAYWGYVGYGLFDPEALGPADVPTAAATGRRSDDQQFRGTDHDRSSDPPRRSTASPSDRSGGDRS